MTIRNNICDTVQLFLPAGTYNILKPMNFRPDADTFHRDYKHEKSILNYSRKNKEYFPQVSLSRMICGSHRSVGMIIRFSAPKILFGTNLCEICDTDFNALIATLKEKLTYLGIEIETNVLKKAEVVSIDFGKNILLPTGVACLSVIHEMGRWHPFSHLNCEKVNYRGNGSQVHYRSQKLDITVYDKTMESRSLLSTRKARDEAHHIAINPYMQKSSPQILRLEIRLSGKKEIRHALKNICGVSTFFLSFEKLFSSKFSKQINLYYWKKMLQCRPICRVTEEAAKNVLDQLLKKFKGPKAMQLFGVFSSLQTYTQQELLKLMNRNETIRNNIKLLTSISVAPNTTDRILQDITKKIEENICL